MNEDVCNEQMQEVEGFHTAIYVMFLLLANLAITACGQKSVKGCLWIFKLLLWGRNVDIWRQKWVILQLLCSCHYIAVDAKFLCSSHEFVPLETGHRFERLVSNAERPCTKQYGEVFLDCWEHRQ